MTIEKKARWIAGTLTGLLLLAVISTTYYYHTGRTYKNDADKARLAQDSILAVKQLLDKEIQEMKISLDKAKGQNAELDKKIAASELELHYKQNQIDKLTAENAAVFSLRKQLKELKSDRAIMDKQIQDLLAENQQLRNQNSLLAENISLLEKDKLILQDKLNNADLLNSKAGNFRVDMQKHNGKVTAKSKRTNEIDISFDMPANISSASAGNKEIYIVILDPQKKSIGNKAGNTIRLKDNRTITPAKTQSIDLARNPQTVNSSIKLDGKLKLKGIYIIQIYTSDGIIGSAQVKMN
jgi:hypothetical protein